MSIKKYMVYIILNIACTSLLLTGCSLIGQAEVYHPPVQMTGNVRREEEPEFVVVQRGNLSEVRTLTAQGTQTEESSLYFPLTGEAYEGIYAHSGDVVRKGQVLARLVCKSYREEKQQHAFDLRRVRVQKAYQKELFDAQAMDQEAYTRAVSDLEEEEKYLLNRIAECDAYIEERTLKADIDGVVKYVAGENDIFNGISDETRQMFYLVGGETTYVAFTEKADGLTLGAVYQMELGAHSYEMELAEMTQDEKERWKLTFRFANDDYDPADAGSGKISYKAFELANVLFLPKQAVAVVGEKYYVYELADGRRTAREVTVTAEADGNYVLSGGAAEGEEFLLH